MLLNLTVKHYLLCDIQEGPIRKGHMNCVTGIGALVSEVEPQDRIAWDQCTAIPTRDAGFK